MTAPDRQAEREERDQMLALQTLGREFCDFNRYAEPTIILNCMGWLFSKGVRVVDAAGGREPPERRIHAPWCATQGHVCNCAGNPSGRPGSEPVDNGEMATEPSDESSPSRPFPGSPRAAAPEPLKRLTRGPEVEDPAFAAGRIARAAAAPECPVSEQARRALLAYTEGAGDPLKLQFYRTDVEAIVRDIWACAPAGPEPSFPHCEQCGSSAWFCTICHSRAWKLAPEPRAVATFVEWYKETHRPGVSKREIRRIIETFIAYQDGLAGSPPERGTAAQEGTP